ncbi:metallophosphoesterase [Chitinophaga sancti]|uniref:metallophosphoesterase n=1 Tax=Chitinophaga sancti TaxID=1004 RepID=UPI002A7553D5|nr:metallophosphoesterase [Chitinophaga sancti]WPQ65481.1 metallophosphoesterase [Chitinophaga sancti]
MRAGLNTFILAGLLFLLDLYVFMAIRAVFYGAAARLKTIAFTTYWVISALVLLLVMLLPYLHWEDWSKHLKGYILTIIFAVVFAKLLVAVFLLLDDLRRGVTWIIQRFSAPAPSEMTVRGISRSRFLTQLALITGGGMFATFIYGLSNKYNYKVRQMRLAFKNLPPAFKGLRILQISDIHSGSFDNYDAVRKGVEMINAQKADIVLFTGDLVNELAEEMDQYKSLFSQIKAPMGVYSTLGNHDYGDYHAWPDKDASGFSHLRMQNLEALKQVHADMGWRLMMNEHVVLEKAGQQIGLLGIENWSAMARFPKYGDLKKAYEGAENLPFKILMSHDPTHWDAQVRTEYPDIDLMLAGHTHGMQFGVEIPGFKWSPSRFVFKEWAGLYREGNQRLYVNRGFGFLGYPGRVGILPEITVIELV